MRILTLLFLGQLSWAGISSVTATVYADFPPNCLATDTGPTYAAAAFSCIYTDNFGVTGPYSGHATGQSGIGPFGIGIQLYASASGQGKDTASGHAKVTVDWSDEFTVVGATGTGFLYPQIGGFCDQFGDPTDTLNLTLFGQQCLQTNGFAVLPIPVVFGQPYTISMRGSRECNSFDQHGCVGYTYAYLAGMTFTDASGAPITGLSLVSTNGSTPIPAPVPEVSSWMLLATCGVAAGLLSRRKQ